MHVKVLNKKNIQWSNGYNKMLKGFWKCTWHHIHYIFTPYQRLSRLLASSSVCSLTCLSAPALNQPVTIKDKGARFPLLDHLYPEGLAVNPGGGPARRDEGDTESEAQEPDPGRLDVGQFDVGSPELLSGVITLCLQAVGSQKQTGDKLKEKPGNLRWHYPMSVLKW